MARIKQLPPHEAHKIAAGEVVERPANVVKELIENSLDAGAQHITVHIEQAGKQLIRVIDNGHGMDREDAQLCFIHHATSKISSVSDLQALQTFGFRGEALSSIAAVSDVTLICKDAQMTEGIKLQLHHGTIVSEELVSCNIGTDISVRDLFANVPARKKFLRADDTEWRQITQLFQAFCLDYQSIHFSLYHDGSMVYNCPPTNELQTRIAQLWDTTLAGNILPVIHTDPTFSIQGAISQHQYARYDRNQIFFFVNKRWVKNSNLSKALMKGYMNVLPPARYPAGFLFIEVAGSEVDINIHPRKEEVQFLHPRRIEQALQQLVKKRLEDYLAERIQPKIAAIAPAPRKETLPPLPNLVDFPLPFSAPLELPKNEILPIKKDFPVSQQLVAQQEIGAQQDFTTTTESSEFSILAQLNKTYILIEQSDGLFMVDQHAAHERVLYELFGHRFETTLTTKLLFPIIIDLNKDDMQLLLPQLSLLQDHGIHAEEFGDAQVVIHATPVHCKDIDFRELLITVISWLADPSLQRHEHNIKQLLQERLRAQMACKAAVKAGDNLTIQQMEQLLKDLHKTTNRLTCPHGRPTGWLFSTFEIEKRFKRRL